MRISVTGSSGVGKTTFARALERSLAVPRLELDSVFHLADWQPRERGEFRRIVAEFAEQPKWIVDGNYTSVRDIVWARADIVVFLDLPRWRIMSQLVPRTLRRMVVRETLWNGNRERLRNLLSRDPEKNLLIFSWINHERRRREFDAAVADSKYATIRFVRLRSRADQRRFVTSIEVEQKRR